MPEKIYAIITVDGDLRIGDCQQQKAAIDAMRAIHDKASIVGSTTWFINEYDFNWSELHSESLLALYDSGDELAVHDHLDTHYIESYEQAMELMTKSKQTLENFFRQRHRPVNLLSHRNGCAFQSQASYQALAELDYHILSDVYPGMKWSGRMLKDDQAPGAWRSLSSNEPDAITMDNQQVPLSVLPWRHNPENWLDVHSRQGHFLHLPITTMPLIDRERVQRVVDGCAENAFVVTDTHPYDLQDTNTGLVSDEKCECVHDGILWLKQEYQAHFITAQKAARVLQNRT